ncbi:MAG: hypothetical protein QM747_06905 [Nocardioides sp.]
MSATATRTAAPAPAAALTALDRCDRCGAQALVNVRFRTGGELMFCRHHARQYGGGLRALDVSLHDRSGNPIG